MSLASALDMGHKPTSGTFADSANYADLIPECSDLSIGYQHEHSDSEYLNVRYLEQLIDRLCAVDWASLAIRRDPLEWDAPSPYSTMFPDADEIDSMTDEEVTRWWDEFRLNNR